eukprot:TRINITY_DN2995_c0_g2_i3.p1 TRINITY_DN2995_c0_g2~~TRINITY_DN2995_c0_g2_i3.p1  ORF type:complete len:257 (-),score=54.40 TRINITY_DN2995_c0_g2_i3:216-986(-)
MPHVELRDRQSNINEIEFLTKFKDLPNIVRYFVSYFKDGEIWMVMEYIEGGTLKDLIDPNIDMSENQFAYCCSRVLKGLEILHENNIVHRDIKPSNITISIQGDIKIIDFGLCVDISDGPVTGMCGSAYWMAPEVIRKQMYGIKVDVWSLGVCFAELLNKKMYSEDFSAAKFLYDTACLSQPPPPCRDYTSYHHSSEAYDFVESILIKDSELRPTTTEILSSNFLSRATTDKEIRRLFRLVSINKRFEDQGWEGMM